MASASLLNVPQLQGMTMMRVCWGELFLGVILSRAVRGKAVHLFIKVLKQETVQENYPKVGNKVKR